MSFENVQVGDKIIVYPHSRSAALATLLHVNKVSKTTFSAGGSTFMKISGRKRGASTYSPVYAKKFSEEEFERMKVYNEKAFDQANRRVAINKISDFRNYNSLTTKQLQDIAAMFPDSV